MSDSTDLLTKKIIPTGPNPVTRPDLSKPLVQDPSQINPGIPSPKQLGPLQYLIGTWTNQNLGKSGKGGVDSPFSYNVMPLPQVAPQSPLGYILKNFSYYEELTFSAIHGPVANRGGQGTQTAYTLFYEQRVYFAEGPAKDTLVHAENGTLLFLSEDNGPSPLPTGAQLLGPYGNGDNPGIGSQYVQPVIAPKQNHNIVKQVSVPHGNSIQAVGTYFCSNPSSPSFIPPANTLPWGVNTSPYHTPDPVMNPNPQYTLNPNRALQNALSIRLPSNVITLSVSSANSGGGINNINFEKNVANVSRYDFTYWLESFESNNYPIPQKMPVYTQLQYSQTIWIGIPVNGVVTTFPHVTVNTLTKVS